MIVLLPRCCLFHVRNHADHCLRHTLGFELRGTAAMAELVGLAPELAGFLGIRRHRSPPIANITISYHFAPVFVLISCTSRFSRASSKVFSTPGSCKIFRISFLSTSLPVSVISKVTGTVISAIIHPLYVEWFDEIRTIYTTVVYHHQG